jgi:dTDP-4-amino-4,6-dideoxygalactose transaminase
MPTTAPVPLLDVNRQNAPLAAEINAALAQITTTGAFIQGPACVDFERAMAEYCGTQHAVGCASGSDALLLPLLALGIGPGDEVILPSFTFFATAGAVWRVGATPVFADILPDTFNLDPADVARRITPRTRAIIPVHLFGQAADMDAIGDLARQHQIAIIEDAAQAIGARFRDQPVGQLGDVAAFSFYPTKNLGGFGDGGLMTTNNAELAESLCRFRNHGQHPRYYHHVVGINSRLDAMQAAVLHVKLRHLDSWAAARASHATRYADALAGSEFADLIVAPVVDQRAESVWNQYTVRVTGGRRDALQTFLSERKIGSAVYYPVPLHLQPCFAELGYRAGDLPHSEQAADEVLSLPVYAELAADEQTRVIEALSDFAASDRLSSRISGPAQTVDFGASAANSDLATRKAG